MMVQIAHLRPRHAGQDSACCGSGVLWHFLDIIWVGIFSIVYLGGLA